MGRARHRRARRTDRAGRRLYARGPSLPSIGQGFQRQPRAGNAVRAVALLPAVTGNLGRPGTGGRYLLNGSASRHLDEDYVASEELARHRPDPTSVWIWSHAW